MKAIILAAGRGTRLNKYTQNMPKGMLEVFGKSIIEHQVDTYKKLGFSEIIIIKGHCADKIDIEGTTSYINTQYATTNMVESLFCAEESLNGEVYISYADILFEPAVLQKAINDSHDIGVIVDKDWKDYWKARYGKVNFDTESLKISNSGTISELGTADPDINEIDGRYVGLLKFSPVGTKIMKDVYHKLKEESQKRELNNNNFLNMYMTDFLLEIIKSGNNVYPISIERGWLEFDTNEDYEKILEMDKNNSLKDFFKKETFN